MKSLLIALALSAAAVVARADAVEALKSFVRDAKTGHATFTQTVTSPDGKKKKVSSGSFEFSRPNRFRFTYIKPFEQTIVGDGEKVWIYDADLNQASSRRMTKALGATPAALLAGGSLDKDFDLSPLPSKDGLDWALAAPKAKDSGFQSLHVGFKGNTLAALDIVDSFGQHSLLQFSDVATNVQVAEDGFHFTPPKGADVIEQ